MFSICSLGPTQANFWAWLPTCDISTNLMTTDLTTSGSGTDVLQSALPAIHLMGIVSIHHFCMLFAVTNWTRKIFFTLFSFMWKVKTLKAQAFLLKKFFFSSLKRLVLACAVCGVVLVAEHVTCVMHKGSVFSLELSLNTVPYWFVWKLSLCWAGHIYTSLSYLKRLLRESSYGTEISS